jgi:hypothetical protein
MEQTSGADRLGSTDIKYLCFLRLHNATYVILTIKWGVMIQNELSQDWSRQITHPLAEEFDCLMSIAHKLLTTRRKSQIKSSMEHVKAHSGNRR